MDEKRVVIIGLGVIAKHHIEAIQRTKMFRIVAVCDIEESLARNPLYAHLPFYTDYKEMLHEQCPEISVICTPPNTHRSIAQYFIEHGVHVLVEKPLSDKQADAEYFFRQEILEHYTPLFHSICAVEVIWAKQNLLLSNIRKIEQSFSDPYFTHNVIASNRISLGGCWLDSGVNALAILSLWVNLDKLRICNLRHRIDRKRALPVASSFKAQTEDIKVNLEIHWDKGINHKQTVIEDELHRYRIDHSDQSVWCDGQCLFHDDSEERLTRHYIEFYSHFPRMTLPSNEVRTLYEIVFKQ